jgi:two-component system response regulator LytT
MKTENQILIGGYRKISPSDIIMLKADTNYTITYLVDGSHFLSATTLGILEERLKGFNFFRTHRSTLINMNYISLLAAKEYLNYSHGIKLNNELKIQIARRKVPEFIRTMELMAIN